ncbi:MAG: 2-oxoglutarate and iron-dependent oxygenase domain-containing protein [Chloroflexota bacterium]|nr:isopenicillin N synthase family oxygenase [Chloroflexota bacterium]
MTSANANWTDLPVLDFSRFQAGSAEEKEAFLAELRQVAYQLGFFYLSGHGIDESLIQEIRTISRRFFNLPEQDKLAIEMVNSPHFRGYTRVGREQTRGLPDWREQIDLGAERPILPQDVGLPPWSRMQGPNQWPEALPELREVTLRYQDALSALAIRLIQALAAALGQPETIFDPFITPSPNQLLKLIHYPGRDATGGDQGVGPHKDSGFVTILLQDEQAGLQVEHEGSWIDAPPVPGTFVINIGELLELASNGYLRANVHQVVTPPAGVDRFSFAFFFGAGLDATVPLLSLPLELAGQVRGLTRDPLNPLFYEVGKNNLKNRLRSHPDVARRHYADLLEPAEREGIASPLVGSEYSG